MSEHPTVELPFERLSEEEMRDAAEAFLARMRTRRSVREFRPDPVHTTRTPLIRPRARISGAASAELLRPDVVFEAVAHS